jgi:hypothetical protein
MWISFLQLPTWLHGPAYAPATTRAAESESRAKPARVMLGCGEHYVRRPGARVIRKTPTSSLSSVAWPPDAGSNEPPWLSRTTILVIAYHMLKNRCQYQELGGDYFDRLRGDGLKRYYVKRLQQLGLTITVEPISASA